MAHGFRGFDFAASWRGCGPALPHLQSVWTVRGSGAGLADGDLAR